MAAPAALEEVRLQTADAPASARIEPLARALLGADYALDPEGEGVPPDADAPWRFDAFDCLTYVENVLAYALGRDDLEVAWLRSTLRYGDAPPSYASRHHLMELQWLPSAVRHGLVVDRTATVGPTRRIALDVTRTAWTSWAGRSRFPMTDDELPTGTAAIEVVRGTDLLTALDRLPLPSLILPVRAPRAWRPVLTFHAGFAVAGADGPRLLHATKLGDGAVRDDALAWYLGHLDTYPWPVEGVAVYGLAASDSLDR